MCFRWTESGAEDVEIVDYHRGGERDEDTDGQDAHPPGEMLVEEFLKPLRMTQVELANRIGVSYVRLNEIVNGKRGITPSTALRLAKVFGTTPDFWLSGQLALDLYRASHDENETREVEKIEPVVY